MMCRHCTSWSRSARCTHKPDRLGKTRLARPLLRAPQCPIRETPTHRSNPRSYRRHADRPPGIDFATLLNALKFSSRSHHERKVAASIAKQSELETLIAKRKPTRWIDAPRTTRRHESP